MSQLFEDTEGLLLRTARKDWPCVGDGSWKSRHTPDCEGIKEGESYVECVWETPAYQSGARVSLACAEAFYTDARA